MDVNAVVDEARGVHAVLIFGPTASGKSALACAIARARGGVVVNADSMQVYRELRVITNRPSADDEAAVPHRLYGFRSAAQAYSTALWLADVRAALDEADVNNWLPVIVGGTGLYFKALTEGLSAIPDIAPEIREAVRARAAQLPSEMLHAELTLRDPETAARLRPSDLQRIARALEVIEATGRPLAEWQRMREAPLIPPERALCVAVLVEREELYRRCEARFDTMLENGAVDEARSIAGLNLDPGLPAMRAVGLAPLLTHIAGQASLAEASALAKQHTRNYAKRQVTWLSGNFKSWKRV